MIESVFVTATEDFGVVFDLARERHLNYRISQAWPGDIPESPPEFNGLLALTGPGCELNLGSLDEDLSSLAWQRTTGALEAASHLNAKFLILPSCWHPVAAAEGGLKSSINRMTTRLETLLSRYVNDSPSAPILLLENHMDADPGILETLLARLDSPYLQVALHAGCASVFSGLPLIDWIDRLGNRLAFVTASNNDGRSLERAPLDEGGIDFSSVLNHLVLRANRIHLCVEGGSPETVKTGLAFVEPLLAQQKEEFSAKSFLI